MTVSLRFDLAGLPCRLTGDDGVPWSRIQPLFSAFALLSEGDAGRHGPAYHLSCAADGSTFALIDRHGVEQVRGEISHVLGRLVSELTAVALTYFDGLAVHAGVVGVGGQGIVFPAVSGTGKSTLTAACVMAGSYYLSDEALLVPYGCAHAVPFPKPIAVSGDSATLLGLPIRRWDVKDVVAPATLGSIADGPVPVAHVVSLRRSGDGRSIPCEGSRANTVPALLSMQFNAHRDPRSAVATAAAIAREARYWVLDVGDPHEAAAALRDLAG